MIRRIKEAIAIVTLLACMSSSSVLATFTGTVAVTQGTMSSATMQPPTALTATGGCQVLILGPKITLNWTITSSAFASGYVIYRSTTSGGPYTFLANVSGRTTTTYTDTTASGLNSTYYYVMQSVFLNWNSTNSLQATGKTPLLCL